mmetsp:Transcript_14973/g.23177  ORF Transcript_14973/g.23177 Transcript_14973/m.23177 type:complete len:89 (+) Transcript_14973:3767-4033(+)
MYKILTLDDGGGFIDYEFDHFTCANSVAGTTYTCQYYNISSSNTAIVPVTNQNGYSLDPPSIVDIGSGVEKLRVRVPTDTLRNATYGN